MKAGIGFCRRPLTGAVMVGMLAIGTSAFGQEIRLFPIRSAPIGSPLGTIGDPITPTFDGVNNCWDYAIDAGGVEVDIDVQGGGWGNADPGAGPVGPLGGPALGAIQATVLAAGYSNGVGADIGPKGGLGSGFYRADSICGAGGDGSPCSPPFDGTCVSQGGGFCIPNTNQIFQAPGMNADALCAIAVPTLNYSYACAAQNVLNTFDQDPSGFSTFGGLILDVPAGAAGTYVIDIDTDPNNSFMTSGTGAPIAGVAFTGACITVTTGKCCSNISATNTVCEDNLTIADCNNRPGPRKFTANATCDGPTVEDDCPSCSSDADCSDGNACTTDSCVIPPGEAFGACAPSVDNYDSNVDCCDPATGDLTAIDDGDVCTDDSCDAATGGVAHDPNTGAACDDGFACTSSDTCNAGVCEGTDVNTIPCTVNEDCPLGECGSAGLCECSEDTPLLCTISNAANEENCFADGEPVEVAIGIGAGSEIVYGAQFYLQYSADCLDFVDLGACEGTVFTSVIEWSHDAATGTIWYAVTIDPDGDLAGTPGPEDVLCINFTYAGGCEGCTPSVAFDSVNPYNTRLSNNTGNPVPTITSDCKGIRGLGEITLNTPDDVDVNADCGLPSAIVNWDAPSATDTCDGDLTVACIAEHTEGYDISGLLAGNGGEFPQGTAFFRCEASNSCGDTAVDVWTVDVSDQHGLTVEVHLSPEILGDNFERAIQFQLYHDCFSDPTEICEVMTFGGPYNFNGHARSVLKVDKGNYQCITARDCLHTLRSAADVFCEDNGWKAIFKGDPLQGGNWLVGGNLDCWKPGGAPDTIDILDAGIYLSVLAGNQGSTSPGANTDCDTEGPHADINADGVVDSADYSFVLENFLEASKDACCPEAEAPIAEGRTSYSVTELRKMGFGDLASGDLNGDGFLDMTDLDLYSQGVQPTPLHVPASKRGASSSR